MSKIAKVLYIIITITFIFFISTFSLYANTSITGAYGYFTIPITSTPQRGTININAGYIFTPGNFYVSANTSFINNWELSLGKEILTSEGSDMGSTPFIIGTKYKFYEKQKGGFRAACGLQLEILGKSANVDGTPVSLYGVISDNAGKLGYINAGFGYVFGIDMGYRINFLLGIRKPLIEDKLFVVGEFTNYTIRQGLDKPWDEGRGIFNGGLLLELTDFLKFKLAFFDLFDDFLTVGLGGEVKLKAF